MRCSIACSLALSLALAAARRASAEDPLAEMNAAFRSAYARGRLSALAAGGPVIFQGADGLVLIRGVERSTAPANSPLYHDLKAVAHVPLAIYVMLDRSADAPLGEAPLRELKAYRTLVLKSRSALASRGLGANLARQERLLDAAAALLDRVLASGRVSRGELLAYCRAQTADIEENIRGAAQDQIAATDAAVSRWLAALSPSERERLRVVVVGSHMPRVGNVALQYFQAKLGLGYGGRWADEAEGQGRLVYADSLWDEGKALGLLATHEIDGDAGEAFFGEAGRMHRDIMADAAQEAIAAKLGRRPGPR